MNKNRRNRIQKEIDRLQLIVDILDEDEMKNRNIKTDVVDVNANIESILYEEQDAFENMPESLQYSERGQRSEECIDLLDEANDAIGELIDMIDDEETEIEDISDKISEIMDTLEDIIIT